MAGKIVIRGARQHNLKNIDLEIPKEKLVVITGVSGSGKSTLAFDTIYAEGQRRYVESLSAYARQFLGQLERPDVDAIDGLSPAIAVEQKRSANQNPRSTVGTVTEIYDYVRLLFARVGKPYCFQCGREISRLTIQQMVDQILSLPSETPIHVLAPILPGRKGDYRGELHDLARAGFARVKIDGKVYDLAEEIRLRKNQSHEIALIVDRLRVRHGIEKRLADSLEVASRYGNQVVVVEAFSREGAEQGEKLVFSQKFACVECGVGYPEITPRLFSFNSAYGACPGCAGLGTISDRKALSSNASSSKGEKPCPKCKGTRLRGESLFVRIAGQNIAEIGRLSIKEARQFFTSLKLSQQEKKIAHEILAEISTRLNFLIEAGLEYLSLERSSKTLSGGEAQRVRLATQIGSRLTGILYVLDEPSIGLHARDQARLLNLLKQLRDLGNTVLVVEHDRETILEADHVIDMGPGAGVHGGEIVAQGSPREILCNPGSLTGQYLSGRLSIVPPMMRRQDKKKVLILKGARANNLKAITVSFPIGAMTCVTGVSGSGKSTLIIDTLQKALAQRLHRSREKPGAFDELVGWENLRRVVNVDQAPIGVTPRSSPATYTGIFDSIRGLFAQLPEARVRGYRPGRFSFNAKGGRCEACRGEGLVRLEMFFLADVYLTCEICQGSRYSRETLEVKYKGLSIADILNLTVNQALEVLGNFPAVFSRLETLRDVGLGYLRLGQPAPTLSGGEAQRVKLAHELSKRSAGDGIYILDEPTTGLHLDDIKKLLDIVNRLTEAGNTVVIIEHNLDVIKCADYIVDLGPEGGEGGGKLVAAGPPDTICLAENSHTGRFLKRDSKRIFRTIF